MKHIVRFMLVVALAICPLLAMGEMHQESLSIAVSVDSYPFHFKNAEGQPEGIFIDYWKLWAAKTGHNVEFRMLSWPDTLAMVRDGQADIHAGCFYSEQRDEYLDYSQPFKECDTHFFFHESMGSLNHLDDLKPFRIGLVSKDYSEEYLTRTLPGAAIVAYPNHEALIEGAVAGEIRVFVADTPTALYLLEQVGQKHRFHYHPTRPLYSHRFYAAVQQGNTSLNQAIIDGMKQISTAEKLAIERKWMLLEERRSSDVLVIACDRGYKPFTFLSSRGEPAGLLIDLWRTWAKKTDTTIEFLFTDWAGTLEALKDGRADLHSGLFASVSRSEWLSFSEPVYDVRSRIFYSTQAGDVKTLADLEGRPFGTIRSSFQEEFLFKNHPRLKLIRFSTLEEMYRAADRDEIHAFMVETIPMHTRKSDLPKLGYFKPLPYPHLSNKMHCGVLKKRDSLLGLVNQGLAKITPREWQMLEERWIPESAGRIHADEQVKIALTAEEDAFIKAHSPIRIANENDWPPFDFVDHGAPQGLIIDYMRMLESRIPNAKFEFVNGYSWNELLQMAYDGSLDVLPIAAVTPEREEHLIFTEHHTKIQNSITMLEGNNQIRSLKDLFGKKLALIKGYYQETLVLKHYPQIHVVSVTDTKEALEAVQSGRADALLDTLGVVNYIINKHFMTGFKHVTTIEDEALAYFNSAAACHKDTPQLRSILQKAIYSIPESEIIALNRKWLGSVPTHTLIATADKIDLSEAEKRFIENNPVIPMGYDYDWAPFDFRDQQGLHSGIASSYVELIEERTGLKFEYPETKDWNEVINKAKAGQIHILPAALKTPQRSQYLNFSTPYFSTPIAIITQDNVSYVSSLNALKGKKVVVRGYAIHDLVLTHHPELHIEPTSTATEALKMVSSGEAFAYLGNLVVVSHIIKREGLSNLKVSGGTPYKYDLSFAVQKEMPELFSIIQKALDAVTEDQHTAIQDKWVTITYDHRFNYALLWKILSGIAVLLGAVLFWNRRMAREISNRKRVERELKRANDAKSEFLANISHEIRTPMNTVLGFTEILQSIEMDEQKVHYIDAIQTSGQTLLNLINDILDLSKIEAGKLELQYDAVSINIFLDEIRTIFNQKVVDKGLSFLVEATPEVPEVLLLDITRLRQILINLISNAIKFTEEGYIRVKLGGKSSTPELQGRFDLWIEVEDTGCGVPRDQQKIIFEAFEQVKGQKTARFGGTGLGLAITQRLVNMMEGSISIISDVGQGTTFRLKIPNLEITTIQALHSTLPQQQELNELNFKPATLLIADDIDYNREMLSTYLNAYNFHLIFAQNGQEVLEQAKEHSPDLILLDMKMPKLDGYATVPLLKQDPHLKKIPVIAVTASVLKQDEDKVRAICDGFLSKPVSKKRLLAELMNFLPYSRSVEPPEHEPQTDIKTTGAPAETLLLDMQESANKMDYARLLELNVEVRKADPLLADTFAELLNRFDYKTLTLEINQLLEEEPALNHD